MLGLQRRRSVSVWGVAVLVASLVAVLVVGAPVAGASPRSATYWAVHYARGYTIQGSWLCYGWTNGYYRCTQHWHYEGREGIPTSDVPAWLPNGLGAGRSVTPDTNHDRATGSDSGVSQTRGQPCAGYAVTWPARISQWTVPNGCFGRIFFPNPVNYPVRPSYGWCNWWPEVLHPQYSGNTALHLPSHSAPVPGAVVFFAGGVQGASWAGHYAQVVAIAPDHYWLLVTEMNFYWRGGGWQKVDYRYIHVGAGVSFRY